MSELPIVNVGYRSTNYWVIGTGRSRLLLDLGWQLIAEHLGPEAA